MVLHITANSQQLKKREASKSEHNSTVLLCYSDGHVQTAECSLLKLKWLWNSLILMLLSLYDLHKKTRWSFRRWIKESQLEEKKKRFAKFTLFHHRQLLFTTVRTNKQWKIPAVSLNKKDRITSRKRINPSTFNDAGLLCLFPKTFTKDSMSSIHKLGIEDE